MAPGWNPGQEDSKNEANEFCDRRSTRHRRGGRRRAGDDDADGTEEAADADAEAGTRGRKAELLHRPVDLERVRQGGPGGRRRRHDGTRLLRLVAGQVLPRLHDAVREPHGPDPDRGHHGLGRRQEALHVDELRQHGPPRDGDRQVRERNLDLVGRDEDGRQAREDPLRRGRHDAGGLHLPLGKPRPTARTGTG